MLPPIALTDEVTALAAAFATMVAVHSGVGQVVDVNLIESMLQIMGPLVSLYGTTGEMQERLGSQIPYTVPRNTYQTSDGHWVAVSSSAESVAQRVVDLVGLGDDARFSSFSGRVDHREYLDDHVRDWINKRTRSEVLTAFDQVGAAVAPVHDMAAIFADEHFRAREAVVEVDGVPMQNLIARLSATPGELRWAGREMDADGAEIRAEARSAIRADGDPDPE
jgi:crotonobetainyl-CoA:carnitine CoA-transferase CaiB-like acyl-CoA transferase